MKKRSDLLWLGVFNIAYLVGAGLICSATRNYEFVLYIGVVVIVGVVLLTINRRIPLSTTLLWGMSIWGLTHMLGGLWHVPSQWTTAAGSKVLYNLWLIDRLIKFDQLIHAYGFGLCAWLIWQILNHTLKKVKQRIGEPHPASFGLLSLCVLGSMGLGALNEVIEFFATLILPETNVGGYYNTGWDLVANMFGAVVAAILIYRHSLVNIKH